MNNFVFVCKFVFPDHCLLLFMGWGNIQLLKLLTTGDLNFLAFEWNATQGDLQIKPQNSNFLW